MSVGDDGFLREKLACFALSTDFLDVYCSRCLASPITEPLRKCSQCHQIRYCGRECQLGDWKFHKAECESIKKHGVVVDDGTRLVIRLAVLARKKDTEEKSNKRSIDSLVDHLDEPAIQEKATAWLKEFKKYAPAKVPSDETLMSLYSKSSMNSFGVKSESGRSIGVGLCLELSAIDHCCKPATRIAFRGSIALMLPTGNIPDATSIATAQHSYIDDLLPRDERRALLKRDYCFDCHCVGCVDEQRNAKMEAFACSECQNGMILELLGKCDSCGATMDDGQAELCRAAVAAFSSREVKDRLVFKKNPKENKNIALLAEKMMELAESTLHELNVRRLPVLRFLFDCAFDEKRYEKAAEYGLAILKIHEAHQNDEDLALANLRFSIAKALHLASRMEEARSLIKKVAPRFASIYGVNSTISQQANALLMSDQKWVERMKVMQHITEEAPSLSPTPSSSSVSGDSF